MALENSERRANRGALTIFTGSFLAFCIQPLVARVLLPALGGTSAVWVTCLAAFQTLLVGGYAYAHMIARNHMRVHLLLLFSAAVWFSFLAFGFDASSSLSVISSCDPVIGTFVSVAALVGLPYLLFTSNASLVQHLAGGRYRLYGISNIGSFVGLFIHPLVLEPFVSVTGQWLILSAGTLLYSVLLWRVQHASGDDAAMVTDGVKEAVSGGDAAWGKCGGVLWLLIPAASCFLLNAATVHVTSGIAPLPLVWAIFLGAYLLSWTVGFSAIGERLFPAWAFVALALALVCTLGRNEEVLSESGVWKGFSFTLGFVFSACTALHAWLCRIRPSGDMLTRYNLHLAVGGAVGGFLSGVGAPLVFDSVLEWPVAVVAVSAILVKELRSWMTGLSGDWTVMARRGLFFALAGILFVTVNGEISSRRNDVARGRSFYGAWRVHVETLRNAYGKEVDVYNFRHGGTMHGMEPVGKHYRGEPTAYYAPLNGGLSFSMHPGYAAGKPVRAALVGLGVGTMAWYGRSGDRFRFYEICPQVAEVTTDGKWFDFVGNSKADVEIKIGDARKTLESERREGEEKWDVLVVDAYSGDSIPIQLVTEEAFRLYRDRVARGGVIALHLSNWHVDLVPAAKAAAAMLKMECIVTSTPPRGFASMSTWAFLSEAPLTVPSGVRVVPLDDVPDVELPTDACGGLLPFLRMML